MLFWGRFSRARARKPLAKASLLPPPGSARETRRTNLPSGSSDLRISPIATISGSVVTITRVTGWLRLLASLAIASKTCFVIQGFSLKVGAIIAKGGNFSIGTLFACRRQRANTQ